MAYIVICLTDSPPGEGETGEYVAATHRLFTAEEAAKYAGTVATNRKPRVVTAAEYLLNVGGFRLPNLAEPIPAPAEPAKPKREKRERPKSRPQRWADACTAVREAIEKARAACDEVEQAFADLGEVRGEYIEWKENLSENLATSAVGEKLQAVEDLDIDDAHSELDSAISDLESKVEEAEGLDLPLGFGRD